MIPNKVMSFFNQIVAVDSSNSDDNENSMRGLLRHHFTSAHDIAISSRRNSSSPISGLNSPVSPPDDHRSSTSNTTTASERTVSARDREPGRRTGTCRVCLKSFEPEEYSKQCFTCKMPVCEDCTAYSFLGENEDESQWSCSVCRRKKAQIRQLMAGQESTDSLLDIPLVDTLQRRHSDIRLNSSNSGATIQGLGSGLAPPRSPELRRHSDVSPASLKALEKAFLKVHSDKQERDGERQQNSGSRSTSPLIPDNDSSPPTHDRRPSSTNEISRDRDKRTENQDLNCETGRRACTSPKPIPSAIKVRRKSQVPKQHSCDDEARNTSSNTLDSTSGGIPRRASAYDVYQRRAEMGSLTVSGKEAVRRSSFRAVSPKDNEDSIHIDARRRASCRPFSSNDAGEEPSPIGRRASMKVKSGSDMSEPETSRIDINDEERRARRRGSQLPDINAIKAASLLGSARTSNVVPPSSVPSSVVNASGYGDTFRRQSSLSGEDIKIVIDDVDQLDLDQMNAPSTDVAPIRRVRLRKDPNERVHKTRGFGMRVIGGKPSLDGTLYTYIVWTMPGGPAEKAGLKKGDKILELCGIKLMNLSFDEVTSIMDHTGDVMDMVVETQGVSRKNSDASDTLQQSQMRKKAPEIVEPMEPVISPTRRRLPKTPLELHEMSESVNQETNRDKDSKTGDGQTGRIQLELWCKEKQSVLVVSVMAGDSLPPRDDYYFGGSLPEAFVRLRLLPTSDNDQIVFSDVAEQNRNPIWNQMLELRAESGNVLDKALEVTVWDQRPDGEQTFIGETIIPEIDLTIDTPVWYRIENPATPGIKKPNNYFPVSPTLSLDGTPRSLSEERDNETDGGDGTCGFLHPDHAYLLGSRRGSSQSEQLDVEQYQLNQTFSKSLPGSRRSSFQSTQNNSDRDIPPVTYSSKGRRRSSCTPPRPDPDEILKSLKAVKGELGRSMSICGGDWRMRRKSSDRRKESKDSVPELTESASEHTDDDNQARGDWKLGPFQLEPRFNTFVRGGNIAISLELCITKGQLAVKVCSARGLTASDNPPDTYVKMYLRDNDRLLLKRKTRVVSKSCSPEFSQTLKYAIRDVSDRSLVVMLWERQKGFEHNQALGSAEIRVDLLKLCEHVTGWYPLFPIQKTGADSNDSQ